MSGPGGNVSLINPVLVKTSVFERIALDKPLEWFKGLQFGDILVTLILPLLFIIGFGFVLKERHIQWKKNNPDEFDDA